MSSNMNTNRSDPNETLALLGIAAFLVVSGIGTAILTGVLNRAVAWMVEAKLLVTANLVWPLGTLPDGTVFGFDGGRLLILVMAVLLLAAAGIYLLRAWARRRASADERS